MSAKSTGFPVQAEESLFPIMETEPAASCSALKEIGEARRVSGETECMARSTRILFLTMRKLPFRVVQETGAVDSPTSGESALSTRNIKRRLGWGPRAPVGLLPHNEGLRGYPRVQDL